MKILTQRDIHRISAMIKKVEPTQESVAKDKPAATAPQKDYSQDLRLVAGAIMEAAGQIQAGVNLAAKPAPKKKARFTVQRDSNGQMTSVLMEEI